MIGGYTDPQGSRPYFGALHIGLYEGGQLVYVSKVGTGFDERGSSICGTRSSLSLGSTSPFDVGSPTGRGHHWVEPKLVCEVRFTEWTDDGGLSIPRFSGSAPTSGPEECRREPPVTLPPGDAPTPAPASPRTRREPCGSPT